MVSVPIPPRLLSDRQPVAHFLEVHDLILSPSSVMREAPSVRVCALRSPVGPSAARLQPTQA